MRVFRFPLCLALAAGSLAGSLVASAPAQQSFTAAPPSSSSPSIPPPSAAGPADPLTWAPPELRALATTSSWHTDFVVDRSMLTLAGNLYGVDDPTRQAIARLNGIALHLYRFPPSPSYPPALVDSIRATYDALGWKHISTSKPMSGPVVGEGGRTDVWLNMRGVDVDGAVILLAGPGNVSLVGVSGDLRTLDLLHLRGHFGIPKFPDDALPH